MRERLAVSVVSLFLFAAGSLVVGGGGREVGTETEARPSRISSASWGRMLASIESDHYEFHPVGSTTDLTAYEAVNRVHGLRIDLADGGVRVRSAQPGDQDWEWGLQLERFGYEGVLEPVETVAPVAEGNRTEYRRSALTEWYVNERRGLEQGFTVPKPPSAPAVTLLGATRERTVASTPPGTTGLPAPLPPSLVLELRADGLRTRQDSSGESVLMVNETGAEILRYSGLVAWDADGNHLPAKLSATDTGIRIEVDDRGATYPLTIDPFIERAILRASDAQVDDGFGISSAISGDTAIVGAWFEDGGAGDPLDTAGAAYIFERNQGGPGNWGEVKKLVASDAHADSWFGLSVAILGDTAVVGAFHADEGPGGTMENAGSAYIFERNQGGPGNWGEVKRLNASDRQAIDNFGVAVAIFGDTVIVGAYSEEGGAGNPLPRAGAAYIFERNQGGANNWGEAKKLIASDTQRDDRFGVSVAISGDTVVVGAFQEVGPFMPLTFAGAAYVFERNQGGAGNWGEVKKLTASDAQEYDRFGVDVAVSGNTAIVGAFFENGGAGDPRFRAGAAYLFERDLGGANNWGEVKKLTASDTQANDRFGISVAISGDSAVVGADMEGGGAGNPLPGSGAAYLFGRNRNGAGAWGEDRKLTAADAQTNDGFGEVVWISGRTAIVGARFEDGGPGNPISGAGSAYVLDRTNWAYVLDAFGGLHAVGVGATPISPAPPYFGFDVARDMELWGDGAYVLDGFGGVHAAGGAPPLTPGPPYFGFDIAKDLELAAGGGGYALDGFGGVHAVGGAPVITPAAFYFGFDIARDMELGRGGYYVLDGTGGLHAGGGAPAISPAPPAFGFDIAKDFELATAGGGYALDGFGGVHAIGGAPVLAPATPYFGFDVARDFEFEPGSAGYFVLDGFGGLHAGGGATPVSPAPPYFGFDAARDLEIR